MNISPKESPFELLRKAQLLLDNEQPNVAAELMEKTIETARSLPHLQAEVSLARRIFSRAKLQLAAMAHDEGHPEASTTLLNEADEAMKLAIAYLRHPKNDGTFQLPDALEEHALIHSRKGNLAGARDSLEEALVMLRAADKSEGKTWGPATKRLGNTLLAYFSFMKECFYDEDRSEVIDELIAVGRRHSERNQNIAGLLSEKAQCFAQQGRLQEAKGLYEESAQMFEDLGMWEAARIERGHLSAI